ncbi:hypothetical protein [Enhygromyxa salina]|nr:hypothetical protein [Enhygromyxa salina]
MTTSRALLILASSLSLGCAKPGASANPETPLEGVEHEGAPTSEDGAPAIEPDDWPALEAALGGPGLVGWMHASVPDAGLFVFTYRKPGDFFAYVDLPIIPSGDTYTQLAELHRHDKVRLFGQFADNDAAKPHVRATGVELLEAYASAYETPSYERELALPDGVPERDALVGKVHAVDGEGKILVLEWRDAVIPVRVDRPEQVRELWRNDKVRVHVSRASYPAKPAHLVLDPEVEQPVELRERVAEHHGEAVTMRGSLVLFPESPQIVFDIYALQVEDDDGIERNYTLVNFEDMEVFEAIRARLGEIWHDAPETAKNGRNKLIKPGLELEVHGVLNVVSPAQANPQLLLSSPEDVQVLAGGG